MDFLRFLEDLRTPFWDDAMLTITMFGGQLVFLLIALIVFWCVDKRTAVYLMAVGLIGAVLNQFMKLAFHIPRPWILDEHFTIVEQARFTADGYSFPSGHAQNGVGTYGALALVTHHPMLRGICIVLAVLIPFSRMYLGVHTPLDVLTGSAMALAMVFCLRPLFFGNHNGRKIGFLIHFMVLACLCFFCYTLFYPFGPDLDRENLSAGVKTASTLFGAVMGLEFCLYWDYKSLRFPTHAVWWAQIIKVLGGIALVLSVNFLLKVPLAAVFDGVAGRTVRYFLVTVSAGAFWPMTFKWFSRLGG